MDHPVMTFRYNDVEGLSPVARVRVDVVLGGGFVVVRERYDGSFRVLSNCPTRPAAEAAMRLLTS